MTRNTHEHPAEEQRTEQMDASALALKLKTEGAAAPERPENSDHANQGLKSLPFADQALSGALDAEGHRPVLERSRKVR